jgi:hypothetical protein
MQRTKHQGAIEKIKRENDVHLRQLAKKSTYVLFFFFFSAFLGVIRQGEFENTRNKIECVSEKSTRKIFFWGVLFPGGFFDFFSFDFFVALVKRLSVRETQKRDKQCFAGSGVVRLNSSPLPIFFYCVFGRFSIRGTQQRDKKITTSHARLSQFKAE